MAKGYEQQEYEKQLSEAATMLAGEVPAGKERDYLIELSRRFKPKPEYPDGTIAWVHAGPHRTICRRESWGWTAAYPVDGAAGYVFVEDADVTKVEPLRVLSDDEIPLPRSIVAGMTWEQASKRAGVSRPDSVTYNIWLAIADVLRAEAGDHR